MKNILVADDNEINRILIQKMLSKFDVLLKFAIDGEDAYEKLLTKEFDVVLMDINMPVLNGIEATKKIRNLNDPYFKEIPIIALTASIMDRDIKEIFESGFNDYQSKPFKIDDLMDKINKLTPAES